ncbi:unnamed protein product [Allacma fusca]|uniref:Uncharacterized protein n=1 Tax=Allacma fusca TaxID=39272 RepID=A0A8J2KXE0_9HEXA|nr:unnamed protein product [Allacma fusca]
MPNNIRLGNNAAVGRIVIEHGLRTVRYALPQGTTFRLLARNDVQYTPYRFCTAPEYVAALQEIVNREPDRVDMGFVQARLFLRQLSSNQLPERYYTPASPSTSSAEEDDEDFADRFMRPASPGMAETESSSEEEEREE